MTRLAPSWRFLIALAVLGVASPALACSVCFGDPESPMTKGAVMGVVVMIGVVGFVLAGIAGTSLYWMQRSRRLSQATDETSRGRRRDQGGSAVPARINGCDERR